MFPEEILGIFVRQGSACLTVLFGFPKKVSSQKVNRNIKFDCEKSGIAFSSDLVKFRINNLAKDITKDNQNFSSGDESTFLESMKSFEELFAKPALSEKLRFILS